MWTVEEDKRQANFLNRRSALDRPLVFRMVARRSFVTSLPWKGGRRRLAYRLSSVTPWCEDGRVLTSSQ